VAETTAKVADPAVPAAPATQHATGAASPEPATSSTGSPAATPEVTAPQGQPAPQDSGQGTGQSTGQDSGRGGHGDGKPAGDLTPTAAAPADAARPAATPAAEAAATVSSVDGQRPAAPEVATVPVQGVQAPAPAAPAAPVAPAAGPERAAPALPAQQLAAEIVPLRDKQGEHALTISLHPADLGPVTVTARVQGTDIQLDLGGATESGREAIRAALPELRRELERAGFTSCLLDTNAGGSTGERRMPWYLPRTGGEPGTDAGPRSAHPEPNATTRATRPAAGVLDLHA
jgi:flagellar hook-length control protein FliK